MTEGDETPKVKKKLYEESSQFRHWLFTKDDLLKLRTELHKSAIERVKANMRQERNAKGNVSEEDLNSIEKLDFLSIQEELDLCTFYILKIGGICKAFQLNSTVRATAITFMRRFYLYNTVMDYHPKSIMLTCLFLAAKCENHMIPIDKFIAKLPKTSANDVLGLEFTVSQALRFEFLVHHPYRSCYGLFLDMQSVDSVDKIRLLEIYPTALKHIDVAMYTDVPFIFQPSQIAMACMHLADNEIVQKYFEVKFGSNNEALQILLKIIVMVQGFIQNFISPSLDNVRTIDRRLFYVSNPDKNPESALYKKRKEQEEEERSKVLERKAKLEGEKRKNLDSIME